MQPIYRADQLRMWDSFTIAHEPISSLMLMERAGQALANKLFTRCSSQTCIVLCGQGNNGGDGLVLARLAAQKGYDVKVLVVKTRLHGTNDFEENMKRLPQSVQLLFLDENNYSSFSFAGFVIDALFGSGLNKPLSGWLKSLVQKVNRERSFCVALDIPSGLFADDNRNNDLDAIMKADLSLSIQQAKRSFFYADYHSFVGQFDVVDIRLHTDFQLDCQVFWVTQADIQLTGKEKFANKSNYGYLYLLAGWENMGGAAVLAAKAAFQMGCGYVGLSSNATNYKNMLEIIPETIFLDTDEIPKKANAGAIGPGLGTSPDALDMLKRVIESNLPLVIDADALNIIAEHQLSIPPNSILTPHLGELKRLIGAWSSSEECLEKQIAFSVNNQIYIIQKGAYSKLTTPQGQVFINSSGNAGMAKAGMGDTLCGIIGSLLAQHYPPEKAAIYGMFIHGFAADLAVKNTGEISLLPSDLINYLPKAVMQLQM